MHIKEEHCTIRLFIQTKIGLGQSQQNTQNRSPVSVSSQILQ